MNYLQPGAAVFDFCFGLRRWAAWMGSRLARWLVGPGNADPDLYSDSKATDSPTTAANYYSCWYLHVRCLDFVVRGCTGISNFTITTTLSFHASATIPNSILFSSLDSLGVVGRQDLPARARFTIKHCDYLHSDANFAALNVSDAIDFGWVRAPNFLRYRGQPATLPNSFIHYFIIASWVVESTTLMPRTDSTAPPATAATCRSYSVSVVATAIITNVAEL